jgi:hypothetical protein
MDPLRLTTEDLSRRAAVDSDRGDVARQGRRIWRAQMTLRHLENLFGAERDENHTKITTEGARYYLHVTKGERYPDEIGQVFSTREEAIAHASAVATELAQDNIPVSF